MIYAAGAGGFYLLLQFAPESIGFYGLLFFYVIHLPGVAVVNLALLPWGGTNDGLMSHSGVATALIAINASLVFLLSWVRSRN